MLTFCLFSSNKRAKNCRDKIREYKDISELASTNFVNKIVSLIRNGNYQYVD